MLAPTGKRASSEGTIGCFGCSPGEGVRQQIINSMIRPGQFISQRELMELLEMPLATVCELIPRLEVAGLIKTVPKRGLHVASVDMKLIPSAWQARAMVEREVVVHFARVARAQTVAELIAKNEAIFERAVKPHPDKGCSPVRSHRCNGSTHRASASASADEKK